ncbi:S66 peptidase family protein [Roseivirga sp.]|uniref:S66 peptidase family protein n=1 Tax=Roseivirga sp. TaxID=1964215 RepID=UPI003B52EF90
MLTPLQSGDQIAVVATAKRLEKSIDEGVKLLESWGLKVHRGQFLSADSDYFAATDEQRLQDLQWALDSPEIKAIVFARGGYGTTRILDQIDFTAFKEFPKWTIGFSDLTSFLLQAGQLFIPAVHGPMAYTLGQDEPSDALLRNLLFGQHDFEIDLSPNSHNIEGTTSAQITGGNLSLIYESIGAGNEIDTAGRILFLEEIGEDFYSVDRMLNKLKRTGKLNDLKGLLVGDFTNVKDSNGYFSMSLNELISSYFDHLSCPKVFGFPAGHEKRNVPLIFHQNAQLNITPERLNLKYV